MKKILIILFFLLTGCQCSWALHKDSRFLMGTIVEVISPDSRAADIVFKEVERIDALLSIYKEESEISQLNKQGKIKASADMLFVVKRAGEFWSQTQGAFDVTVGPLVKLWGFYDRNYRVPKDPEIKEISKLIGFDKLSIDDNIIAFKIKNMKIDLGAIAKGYAVDCAVKKLKAAGISSALINAGGDIYCLGDKRGNPWRVAIKTGKGSNPVEYLELMDKAVATSGNYEQYFSVNNVRYCHILNPKTGKPADSGVKSVTVVADNCLLADALATSIFVLGRTSSEELVKRFNAEAKISTDVQNNK